MEKASTVRDSWTMFCLLKNQEWIGDYGGRLVCFKGGVLLLASDLGVVLVCFLVDA